MSQSPAAAFLSSRVPKELNPESTPVEMLDLLISLQLREEDRILALVYATDLIDTCLQSTPPPSALPDITPLLSLAECLFSEGYHRLIQSFYSVLVRLVRSQLINDVASDIILRIATILSMLVNKLSSNECLYLLSFYLDSSDKAIFSLGVQIVEKSRKVEQVILTPASAFDLELASMLSAGSFIHQVNLAPYFSVACKFSSIFMHIDKLSLCYGMYERCLKTAYTSVLNKLDLSQQSSTHGTSAENHAICVLTVLFPYLFSSTISIIQLEFLSDIFAIASQHAQSDNIYNILVDIVAELRGLASLYEEGSFLKRVEVLKKANLAFSQLPFEPLLFATYMRTSCNTESGIFHPILMRLAICIYKMEILLCKRNTSVKYNAIIQTSLTKHINGKPISECKGLLEAARAPDASQELRLYVNLRETQKTPLRKT
ncbi:Hypothetical protein GLP15_4633 [Giardia lamblia P15]|uniref:Uncharacterized protein n=1 Tax=Giardia intestinalis (strain P15) TaxID=658858 RepID=E1F5P6_GIAIA|nr:Hypothetical protein GLP15_4633 [Giardia lamblia P15]